MRDWSTRRNAPQCNGFSKSEWIGITPVFYSDKFLCQRRMFETGQIVFRVGRVLDARTTNAI
jgi:hypothetical protein